MIVGFDHLFVGIGQQAVADKVFDEIVVNLALIQIFVFNQQLGIAALFNHCVRLVLKEMKGVSEKRPMKCTANSCRAQG